MLKKTQHRELSVMGTLKLINGGGGGGGLCFFQKGYDYQIQRELYTQCPYTSE